MDVLLDLKYNGFLLVFKCPTFPEIISNGVLSITLPMVTNPRYMPLHSLVNEEKQKELKESLKNPEFVAVSDVDYQFNFTANINQSGNQSETGSNSNTE